MLSAKRKTIPITIAAMMAAVSPALAQNPISAVTMDDPSRFFYRNNLSFTFTMASSMPSSMETVTLLLMDDDSETSCALLRYPFRVAAVLGSNTVSLRTPTCAAPGTDYKIRVIATATQFRDSGSFEIAQSNENCIAGEFNANSGTEPGCIQCPIGQYSTSAGQTACVNCAAGMTTSFRGATNANACNVTVVPAEQGYLKFDKTYFYHSNAGGTLLMAHEHKTIEECQRACTMSPGCKAFDGGGVVGTFAYGGPPMPGNGNQEIFQAGDCFLSYDTIGTIKEGDVGMTNQLELFQKVEAQKVKEIFFRKTPNCYILESNDGGSYKDEHSPEACAQLCLNDNSCVSYDAGTVRAGTDGQRWQPAIDDCFLSYKNRSSVSDDDWVCDSEAGLDYFERIVPQYLEINMPFENIVSWDKGFREESPNLPEWLSWTTGEAAYWNNRQSCSPQPACFNNVRRPRKSCPVTWDYDQLVAPLYPFIGTRDSYATAVAAAVAGELSIDASVLAVRVEESTGVDGTPGSTPATTAVVNLGNSQNDNAFMRRFRNSRTLSIDGQNYNVVMRAAARCAAGHVSQSGYTPGCMQCPPDSYANWPQTDCGECPLGTISDAGSSTTGEKACRPQEDTSIAALGPFRVGYEWFGFYQAPLGQDAQGRMGRGQMKLRITQAAVVGDSIEFEVYASVRHGEDCNTRRNCRDPGISEFFMAGSVTDGTSVYLSPGGWGGITDRNTNLYTRGPIDAQVSVRDRNTMMSGTVYGGGEEGQITMYERCHSADETGTFEPGNKFVGTYSCYRRGTNMDSPGFGNDPCQSASEGNLPEKDIRRVELLVTSLDEDSGIIQASVNFDHADGEAEYHVSGTYDADSGAITFDAGAGAWNSPHPNSIPARQISGRLSDDKEWFRGQFNANPHCRCNGTTQGGQGGECGTGSILPNVYDPWCFVGADCPDGYAFPGRADTYYGNCNTDRTAFSSQDNFFETCTDVTLARLCSTSPPNCAIGWTSDPIQDRCMRLSTTFPDPAPLNFADAQAFCANQNATLASVHSMDENRFIMDPAYPNGLMGAPETPQPLWIGLNATRIDGEVVQEWTDGTRWGQFTQLSNADAEGCGVVAQNLRWRVQACTAERHFVCWKPPVGRVPDSCACTGETDTDHFGGYCGFWSGRDQASWCYVSPSCVTGVRVSGESELRRASCFAGEFASTEAPLTTIAPVTMAPIGCNRFQYQRMVNGAAECAECNTWSSCNTAIEFLEGTCSTYSNPVCSPLPDGMFVGNTNPPRLGFCDVRCHSCLNPSPNGCTSCMPGSPLFLETFSGQPSGRCVADCQNRGKFKNNETQTCDICDDPGSQQVRQPCLEFSNTQCEQGSSGCAAGSGVVQGSGCCADCADGVTFSANNVCQEVASCVSGEQEDVAPSTSTDRVCEVCPVGTFSLNAGACTDLTTCVAGQYFQEGADEATRPPHADRSCVNCTAGSFSVSQNLARCAAVSPADGCNAGTYQTDAPTRTSNRACQQCAPGTFSLGGGTGPCSDWSTCAPGFYANTDPSVSADRQCAPCNPGITFSLNDNSVECTVAATVCRAGSGETAGPTTTSDRQCETCASGTFNDGSLTSCSELTMCPPGFQTDMPNNRTDRDRTCTPCEARQYSSDWNQLTCRLWNTCRQGREGLVTYPNETHNIICEDCRSRPGPREYASLPVNAPRLPGEVTECLLVPTLAPTPAPNDASASTGEENNSESNSMLLIVIIIVVVVIIVAVGGAVFVVKQAGAAGDASARVQSFANPTYAEAAFDPEYEQGANNGVYSEPNSGYLDVPGANGIGGDEPGYMDVSPGMTFDDSEDV